ncbi:MAG: 4Fe-4S dicluster domain-containing protein [Alphaproteobacteria bacterium]|nr:4Fe-4S dicluster domain-containing protein [Alphaproteobacteria bacterium]
MTSLPAIAPDAKKLGLVIDLDICVGCHACAVNCKQWNSGGFAAPLTDSEPYGAEPSGVWFNRVHAFEAGEGAEGRTVYFPKSCLHCDDAPCVTVCPTGASYKRASDGIVLVDESKCIGCKLCSWACPYGAREYDPNEGVMKKCTLCIDRIYNENIAEAERVPACVSTCPASARHFGDLGDPKSEVSKLVAARGGYDLMPEQGTKPVNKYLPPRPRQNTSCASNAALPVATTEPAGLFLKWVDRLLSR